MVNYAIQENNLNNIFMPKFKYIITIVGSTSQI